MTVAFTAVLAAGLLGAVLPGYLTVAALPAVAVKWGAQSAKAVTVTCANNKPKGARLLEAKAFPKTWKLDVK